MVSTVARTAQLDAIEAAYTAAKAGRGALVLLSGEPGAGKSTVVAQLAAGVARDAEVLVGYCDPLSTPRPAGPLIDVAARLGGPLVEMLAAEQRRGLFDATLTAMSTGPLPRVVVFEDIHWADGLTLELLGFLARRISAVPVLLVVTYRNDHLSSDHPTRVWLGTIATNPAVLDVAVPPLTVEEVAALAADSGLDPIELHARTGGNAFFVSEVLCAPNAVVPGRVADAVAARASTLSMSARRALLVAAVIGSRAEPAVLLAVSGVEADAVDECITAGLLSFIAPVLQFRHELSRQAVLAEASTFSIAAVHGEVLRVLRTIDPNALARLAEHAECAGDGAAVLELAPRAGRRAARLGSHREAASQYRRALAFADGASSDVRAELFAALSFELFLTASLPESLAARRCALNLRNLTSQPEPAADDLRWMSRISWYAGNRAHAETYAWRSRALLGTKGSSRQLGMALSNQSQLLMLAGRYTEAIERGEEALAIADRSEDVETRVHALNNIGISKARLGRSDGVKLLEESLRLALEHDLEDHAARAYVNLTDGVERRDDHAGRRYVDEGRAYCSARELDLQWAYLEASRATWLLYSGKWAEAERVALDLLATATIPVHRIVALLPLVLVRIRRGDRYEDLLDEAAQIAQRLDEPQRLLPVAFARVEAAWLAGAPGAAADELAALQELTDAREDVWRKAELHYWLARTVPGHVPPTNLIGPFGADLMATPREAAAAWSRLDSPYEAAIALLDGDEADVREALVTFQQLGAEPAVRLARSRLRALGVAVIPRGPRRSTAGHPFGLTSREDEVLQLLADRLSNQQIAARLVVSERTVHHHVSALLAKLQVPSRGAAAALAKRHLLRSEENCPA